MLLKRNFWASIIALSFFISGSASAEALVEDFQVWGNITAQGSFAKITNNPDHSKFRFWLEGQGRFGDNASRFSNAIVRPGLGYAVTDKMTVWLGYAWVPTSEPFASARVGQYDEHRIWQQAMWADNTPLGRLTLRSRFEQRFFDAAMAGHNDVGHRFRQLIKLAVPMPFIHPNISYIVQDEIFVNLTDTNRGIYNGYDQNRFFTGLAYKINQYATTEIGYMNLHFNRPHSPRPDQMFHILGVNLLINYQ